MAYIIVIHTILMIILIPIPITITPIPIPISSSVYFLYIASLDDII